MGVIRQTHRRATNLRNKAVVNTSVAREMDIAAQIAANVVADGTHLLWQGPQDQYKGPLLRVDRKKKVAVRGELWRAAGRDIPPGLVLRGICDRDECVAVAHSRLCVRTFGRPAASFDWYLKRLVPDGDCLIFPAKSNRVYLDGRKMPISRAVWEHAHGPAPTGWMVCHRCDRQHCGRLDHLYLALPGQRIRDSFDRQRFPLGEQVSQAKLTWAAVEHIRSSTETRETLARLYGVSPTTIYKVRTWKTWRTKPADDLPPEE